MITPKLSAIISDNLHSPSSEPADPEEREAQKEEDFLKSCMKECFPTDEEVKNLTDGDDESPEC